jgi:hypothetical protein
VNAPEDGFVLFSNVSLMVKPKLVAPAAWMVDTDGTQGSRRIVAPDPATP